MLWSALTEFEVLDLPPMIANRPEARPVNGPPSVQFDRVSFRYPTADDVSLASLESVATAEQRPNAEVLHDVSFTVEAGQTVALVGRSGGGSTITHLVARLYDVSTAPFGWGNRRSGSRAGIAAPFDRLCHPGRPYVPRHHPGELKYARPDLTEEQMLKAIAAAQISELVAGLPDCWTPSSVSGAIDSAVSGSDWPLLDCSRCTAHRGLGRGHRSSRLRIRGGRAACARHGDGRPDQHCDRSPTVNRAQRGLDRGCRPRPDVARGRHAQLLAEGGLYAELYATQFAEDAEVHSARSAPPSTGMTQPVR